MSSHNFNINRCATTEARLRHESKTDMDWDEALNSELGYTVDAELSQELSDRGMTVEEAKTYIWKNDL